MAKLIYRNDSLLPEPLSCAIGEVNSKDRIEVEATMVDELNQKWQSIFTPHYSNGCCSFSMEDIQGNLQYKGIKGIHPVAALFDKIKRRSTPKKHFVRNYTHFHDKDQSLQIKITLNGRILDKRTINLKTRSPRISKKEVTEPFIGKYYFKENAKQPTILVISGSMGDFYWSELAASYLSNYGFNTLAISYFSFRKKNRLPGNLIDIDLEYFTKAMDWIRDQKEYDGNLGVLGFSKGAEAALLLGANHPSLDSIVAISPSSFAFEGVYLGNAQQRGSWKYQGESLPFLSYPTHAKFSLFMNPGYLLKVHEEAIESADSQEQEDARIKAETIKAKTLLISGAMDMTWPSGRMCQKMKEHNPELHWKNYPNMGHIFTLPNLPLLRESGQQPLKEGAEENLQAWYEISGFLADTLKS